jgi:hypothetical protein
MVLRMLAQPWPVSPRPCKKIIEAETEDRVRHTCGFHCFGSGSRKAKMTHKNISAGCSLLRAEGFSAWTSFMEAWEKVT